MSRLRTFSRRLRSTFWTALTLVTVLAAILVGIGKLVMPYSARYQPQLEAWLSEEFGQPVRIDSFTGEWKAFGPRISLQGVTFLGPGGEKGDIAIQQAALDIKPVNGLLPGRPLYTFHIIGADLALSQQADGRWELSGLGVGGSRDGRGRGASTGLLEIVGQLRLENSRLSLDMPQRGVSAQFSGVEGRLQLNGPEIAVELQASLADAPGTRVLGELEATLVLGLDEEQRLTGARWHAKIREFLIRELADSLPSHPLIPRDGRLNAELWGEWTHVTGQFMTGVMDLREAALAGEVETLRVEHVNTRFDWRYLTRKSWRLDFSEFQIDQAGGAWQSERLSLERNIPGNLGLWVSADSLELSFPLELTQRIMSMYGTPWPRHVPRRASGRVSGFDLVLDRRWKLYMAGGQFDGVSASDWGRWPDVSGLSGSADLLAGSGSAAFAGQDVIIEWPRNFRRPLVVDFPGCALDIGWGEYWQVHARDCTLENDLVRAFGRLHFKKTQGKPAVDINVAIERANVADLDHYWPHSLVKPRVSDWLASGVVDGTVSAGRLILRGDMDDWPFEENQGQFEAAADFSDVDLDYYPGWPSARDAAGSLMFRGTRMDVAAAVADLSGNAVEHVGGRIADLRAPVFELAYETRLALPGLARFIRESPLLEKSGMDPEQFTFSGDARISGALTIPLRSRGGETTLGGTLELPGNGFTEQRSGFTLTDVSGTLTFDRQGMSGPALSARYRGHESQIVLEGFWGERPGLRSELSGVMPILDLIPPGLRESEPLLDAISGTAEVSAVLEVEREVAGTEREIWLDVRSDLSGVRIDLPEPLTKPEEAAWPLHFRFPVRSLDTVCTIDIPGRLSMSFDIPGGFDRVERAHFHLGEGPHDLPAAGELSLAGSAAMLDVDAWVERLAERFETDRSLGSLELTPVILSADRIKLLGREFADVELEVAYKDGLLSGSFDSPDLAGGLRYTHSEDGSHSLDAQLDRLIMPVAEGADDDDIIDPTGLPEMHIYIDHFRYLGLDLGATRIEGYPSAGGFRFASIEANSPDFTLNARGDWIRDDEGERSDFDIVMTSESLGSLMDALEISSVLEGGQTVVRYDAWWPGPPASFALARLNGEMAFSVIQGTLINADAGAGRMVGLMSIAALPRRLAFDFRDVFGTGFSFDSAEASMSLENGVAHTNDLVLKSTAATMEIWGSSNLDEQTFDYILSIKPGVGQTLPVLGAIAGGPGGAAAGLALQGLLQRGLGEAAEARYAITGPWRDPLVVRIPMEPQSNSETSDDRPATQR